MSTEESKGDVILRVEKCRNFKTISLTALHDTRLSWKAKGLHTYLVSRPDGWRFFRADVERRSTDGRTSVSTGTRELKEAGYLKIEPVRGGDGTFSGWAWTVYEVPGATTEG